MLAWALESYGDEFAIATSFQKEGMAILDIAARISPRVRVFTLDTGRLPDETYRMIETVRERYGIATEIVQPDPEEVRHLVALRGRDSFYESVDARRACCDVRKVRPLERKLATLSAWATGIRREQSESRADIPKLDLSATPVKINPLADWTAAQVEEYTRVNRVPVHPLYASRICQHRLRAVYAPYYARRRCARGALVVGTKRAQRVRHPLPSRWKIAPGLVTLPPFATSRIPKRELGQYGLHWSVQV